MALLHVALLPSLVVTVDGQPIVQFRSVRTRALLAFLAAERAKAHTRARVAGMLWPDQPQAVALHNLSQTLLQLRQSLGETNASPFILANRQTIQLNPHTCHVDMDEVGQLLTAAQRYAAAGDDVASVSQREQAVSLYQGTLLENFSLQGSDLFEEWLQLTRTHLHRQILEALESLTTYYDQQINDQRATFFARRWVDLDPLNEEAHCQLMRVLARSGQRSAALAQYEMCRRALYNEFGVLPTAQTVVLYEQIRSDIPKEIARGSLVDLSPSQEWSPTSMPIRSTIYGLPNMGSFYGRTAELVTLQGWMGNERSRVVMILGFGGIGKTALATQLVARVAGDYESIVWRSLLNAPPLEETLAACLQTLNQGAALAPHSSIDTQLDALLALLYQRRCLLILDNMESILEPGQQAGRYRSGYGGYGQLIRRVATEDHASCLLLTSREQPHEFGQFVHGNYVRQLRLDGLTTEAGVAIMHGHDLLDDLSIGRVVEHYSGNPLAINLIAATISDLFAGDVSAFLRNAMPVFDTVRDMLDQQFARLSRLERDLIVWLAVERVPVELDHVYAHLANREPQWTVLEAFRSLQRRSLLEHQGKQFTLHNVVMEYTTDMLVSQVVQELQGAALERFAHHVIVCAQAKEYVRQSQKRLILMPIIRQLEARLGRDKLVTYLRALPDTLRMSPNLSVSYAAGNLINMLVELGSSLAGLDFSRLAVWHADLRGVRAPLLNLTHADLHGTMFTENVRAITCVAISPDGQLIAAGTTNGSVCLWRSHENQLLHTYTGHAAVINALAFSPDGVTVASGSMDGTIRLWNSSGETNGRIIHAHATGVIALAFHPHGMLASSGYDGAVHIWDAKNGTVVQSIAAHGGVTFSLAFRSDGAVLVLGAQDGAVYLWHVAEQALASTFLGHTDLVLSVAYSHDGHLIASSSCDRTIHLWNAHTGQVVHVFEGHTNVVATVDFSPDDTLLASGSWDHTVRLWNVHECQLNAVLEGHTSHVSSLAFSSDNETLVSGGYDQTLRFWDTCTQQLTIVRRGHTTWIWSLAFSPDGATLASAHHDQVVRLWDMQRESMLVEVSGHTDEVVTVAISPNGKILASAGNDCSVRLWDTATGQSIGVFQGHTTALYDLCFSYDGRLVASGDLGGIVYVWNLHTGEHRRLQHTQCHSASPVAFGTLLMHETVRLATPAAHSMIQIWDVEAGKSLLFLHGHTATITALAWSKDGTIIASGSWDGTVRLWNADAGRCINILAGHTNYVMATALSPDGCFVASGSLDGTVRVWDIRTGAAAHVLYGHTGGVFAVTFSPDSAIIASGSDDETIRLWDVHTGASKGMLRAAGPYAGMNIANATGLSTARRGALNVLGAVEQSNIAPV